MSNKTLGEGVLTTALADAANELGRSVVRDVLGREWAIHSRTVTRSGVTVLRGWPYPHVPGRGSARGLAVIATEELVDYLRVNACVRHVHRQLGLCSVTVARVRQLTLAQTWRSQREQWWHERADDLRTLSAREFIARHGADWMRRVGSSKVLGSETVNARRRRMYPTLRRPHTSTRRPNAWWRASEISSLLVSRAPAREIADRLGITPGYVYALRMYLKSTPSVAVA
jgi:hypothetical protein